MKGMQSPAVELWSSQERILSCLWRVKQVSPAQGCTQELDLLPAPGSSAWPVGREWPAAPWVTWVAWNPCSAEEPEYNGLTVQLLFPERSHSCGTSIFVDPQGMLLQPFLANQSQWQPRSALGALYLAETLSCSDLSNCARWLWPIYILHFPTRLLLFCLRQSMVLGSRWLRRWSDRDVIGK